jgi:hypothetical protein
MPLQTDIVLLLIENLTTSTVESLNANLKIYISSLRGDLVTVFKRLEIFWANQVANVDNAMHGVYTKPTQISTLSSRTLRPILLPAVSISFKNYYER